MVCILNMSGGIFMSKIHLYLFQVIFPICQATALGHSPLFFIHRAVLKLTF